MGRCLSTICVFTLVPSIRPLALRCGLQRCTGVQFV